MDYDKLFKKIVYIERKVEEFDKRYKGMLDDIYEKLDEIGDALLELEKEHRNGNGKIQG